jgi:feruloyl-CoA synthase
MILSANSIDHATLTLGAMQAGVPAAPVSVAYSLMSTDHAKIAHIRDLVEPAMVYADDGAKFTAALAVAAANGAEVVVGKNPPGDVEATLFEDLLATTPSDAVEQAFAAVGPDTIAKYLFTSGSTGQPKGVINLQRLLCANQQMIAQIRPPMPRTRRPCSTGCRGTTPTAATTTSISSSAIRARCISIPGGRFPGSST